jgi:hypothetical protein
MPAPRRNDLNSILSEVVELKDRPAQQEGESRLVWEASQNSNEFRQFGEASVVDLDTQPSFKTSSDSCL